MTSKPTLPPPQTFLYEEVFLPSRLNVPPIEDYAAHPQLDLLPSFALSVLRELRVSPTFASSHLIDVTALLSFITRANDPDRLCLRLWKSLTEGYDLEESEDLGSHSNNESDEDSYDPSSPTPVCTPSSATTLAPATSSTSSSTSSYSSGSSSASTASTPVNPAASPAATPTSPLLSAESTQKSQTLMLERRAFINSSLVQVLKAGYLQKKGGGKRRANWKRRWFVLERDKISYYVGPDKRVLKGSLELDDLSRIALGADGHITRRKSSHQGILLFSVVTPLRTLLLCASSTQDFKDWMKALSSCIQSQDAPPLMLDAPALSSSSPSTTPNSSTLAPTTPSNPNQPPATTPSPPDKAEKQQFSSSLPPLQAGFLEKLGGSGKMIWQKRWFVLSPDRRLCWYADGKSKIPRNSALLAATGLVQQDTTMRLTVPLQGHIPIVLRAPDESSYRHWVAHLSALISQDDHAATHHGEQAEEILKLHPELQSCVHVGVDPTRLFVSREPIGKGAFGEVFKARYVENGEAMAVKLIQYSHKYSQLIAGEIVSLDRCDHPQIIGLLGCWLWKEWIWLSTAFCDSRTLRDATRLLSIPEPILAGFGYQVMQGLSYLAMLKIIHRDIKGDNILLSCDGTARIADLGLAIDMEDKTIHRGQSGSAGYMAPEILARRTYTTQADVYSFGVLMYCSMYPAFENDSFPLLSFKNMFLGPDLSKLDVSPDLVQLISECTRSDPKLRPTATDALLSRFFTFAQPKDKLALYAKQVLHEESLNTLL